MAFAERWPLCGDKGYEIAPKFYGGVKIIFFKNKYALKYVSTIKNISIKQKRMPTRGVAERWLFRTEVKIRVNSQTIYPLEQKTWPLKSW